MKFLFFLFDRIQSQTSPQPWQVTQMVKEACLPFLRCAAILYHHITSIPVPNILQGMYHLSILFLQTLIILGVHVTYYPLQYDKFNVVPDN